MNIMLSMQVILNLLPTAMIFPLSYLSDPPFQYRIYLPFLAFSFLSLPVFIKEIKKTRLLDPLYPDMDSFPVLTQLPGNVRFRYPLFVELPAYDY